MKTKTNLLLVLMAALTLNLNTGCDYFSKEEKAAQQAALDSLSGVKDSEIQKLMSTLEDVENQLAILNSHSPQFKLSSEQNDKNHKLAQELIFAEIAAINFQMNESKEKIAELKGKLSSASRDKKDLNKMVASLNSELYDSGKRIEQLQTKLADMNVFSGRLTASLDSMFNKTKEQSEQIAALQHEINTVYYTFGTYKELKAEGVVTKQGGFLGLIGKTKAVQQDFNKSYFTSINKEEIVSIPLYAKKVQLLTNHPSGSYKLIAGKEGTVEKIEITDPEKFWDTSSYLVAMVE